MAWELEASRSERKRRAIVEAATALFLENGYRGTSMEQIATVARVSKQTVYKHFEIKERLFYEIVTAAVDQIAVPNYEQILGLADTIDLPADLRDVARQQLGRVMQPRLLQLRRLVIAEASRFPQLGALFYERGPGRTIEAFAAAFKRLAARGLLRLEDPPLAAAHFNWLIMSIPLNEAMLLGRDHTPPDADLDRYARAGVEVFLAAYGTGTVGQ